MFSTMSNILNYVQHIFSRESKNFSWGSFAPPAPAGYQPAGLCFHNFAMLRTFTYLFSSNSSPQRRRSLINKQIYLI